MILTVAGRDYDVEVVQRAKLPAPVAIVIPQHRSLDLVRLAVDAIRAFTPATLASIWVVDNASRQDADLDDLDVNLILNRTPVWRRWQRPEQVGSMANAVGLEIAVQALGMDDTRRPAWLHAMHADSLPAKKGWLGWLCSQPFDMVGCKASQRSGYPHSAGVLYGFDWLHGLGPGALLPSLPFYDVAEGPARLGTYWSAWGFTHDPARCRRPCPVTGWLERERAEVSWDHEGDMFYLHAGGGSIDGRDMSGWIERARKELSV